ncbi:hypothetical protein OIE71_04855 [Streptomyces sp. NBC_01725]|uniref:hypothetical protein n=1 Tax=Streptomyces sp. NBC_01725 TaxID=2975923 RepID=UPI002E2C79BC|nr:hypothetical protein [Streptomyces sp. NBC_01725]
MTAVPTGEILAKLPAPEDLTERQLRGADCVLCKARLDNGSAVDLGKQQADAHGTMVDWFPRCCSGCAS